MVGSAVCEASLLACEEVTESGLAKQYRYHLWHLPCPVFVVHPPVCTSTRKLEAVPQNGSFKIWIAGAEDTNIFVMAIGASLFPRKRRD